MLATIVKGLKGKYVLWDVVACQDHTLRIYRKIDQNNSQCGERHHVGA